jgi:hypothetical protein
MELRTLTIKWNAKLDAKLTELWYDKDYTALKIADTLGFPGAKNAMIGRAHRLGLKHRGNNNRWKNIKAKKPQPEKTEISKVIVKPEKPPEPMIEINPSYDWTTRTWFVDEYPGKEAKTISELLKKLPKNIRVANYRQIA